ncbi:TPA: phage tail protein [Clostridium perfringens]|nr:phage tail spike protein [Clostridium perfringens]HBI7100575.1 phage tail protein [Clostridium perfringens]HBI7111923.1 phage tail protein [Clostridium perfringens]HBI7116102.1 phage tail protein [Clostridium perfringens]HBI7121878.1 phage tail protein [Clostridium perfringens]
MIELRDKDKNRVAGLVDYENLCIESVLESGDKTLSFYYPKKGKYYDEIVEEAYIRTKKDEFVVKARELDEDYTKFECSLNLEELEGNIFDRFESVEQTITSALNLAVVGTGWTVKDNTLKKRRTVRCTNKSSLEIVREIKNVYRVDIVFNTLGKQIEVYEHLGEDKGTYFIDSLNLIALQVQSDSRQYATRIIAEGKDGLSFSDINNGKNYVENYQYSNKVKTIYWKDERYSVKENLLEDARAKLEELSKPFRSYSASILNLAELNPRYSSILDFKLGDAINLISKKNKIKDKQRIVKTIEWPQDHTKDSVELANATLKFEDIQQENQETTDTVSNITTDNGTINGSTIDSIQVKQIENFEANVLKVTKLEVIEASINHLSVIKADIQDLNVVKANIGILEATKANITELNSVRADLQQAIIGKANITDLNAAVGKIHVLESKTASIENALAGNLTAENFKANSIVAGSGIIAEGAIGSAQISSLSVNKLEAGDITTSKHRIVSADGTIEIVGNQILINRNNINRVILGEYRKSDGTTEYGLLVRAKDGQTIMLDGNGVHNAGITDGAIDNNKVADNANISGNKLDINSVIREVNNNGTETIKGTKVTVGDRTLDVELSTQKNTITEHSKELSSQKASLTALDNALKFKVDSQTFTQSTETINSNINRAKEEAIKAAENLALEKSNLAKKYADEVATAKANLAKTEAIANADGKISAEEQKRIQQAQENLNTAISKADKAKQDAIDEANRVAELKKQEAINSANSHADSKANEALNNAKAFVNAEITTVNSHLNKATAEINVLKKQIELKVGQSDVDKSIEDVKFGGRNLWLNTAFLNGTNHFGFYGCENINVINIENEDYKAVEFVSNNLNGGIYQRNGGNNQKIIPFEKGENLIISGYFKCSSTAKLRISLEGSSYGKSFTPKASNEWTYFELKAVGDGIVHTFTLYGSNNNKYTIRQIKVEKGTKATDWTKAPEDTDQLIVDNIKTVTDKITTVESKFTQENNSIKASVQDLNSTTQSITTNVSNINRDLTSKINSNLDAAKNFATDIATNKANTAKQEAINNAKAYTNAEITTVNSKVHNVESNLNILSDRINTKVSQSDIDKSIQNIEFGGRNLFLKSKGPFKSSNEYVGISITSVVEKYLNKKITISADVKANKVGKIRFYSLGGYSVGFWVERDVTTEWTRIKATGKFTLNDEKQKWCDLSFYGTYGSGLFTEVRNVKIELGELASDYTEAPEDTDKLIIDNIKTVTDKISTVESKLTQENNSIKASVQDLNSTTQSITTNVSNINRDLISKINSNLAVAKSFATDIAIAKANLAREQAIASADGKITEEERKRIQQAQENLDTAIARADKAKQDAINAASTDATNKANNALNSAKAFVNAEITTVNNKVHNVESNIDILKNKIALKVEQSDIDKTKTELINKINVVDNLANNAKDLASAMSLGKMLFSDPTFKNSSNNIKTYNNNGNGTVTTSRISKINGCPTDSQYCIEVKTVGSASPNHGGFYFGNMTRANAIFVTKIIAKIPVGLRIGWYSNSTGNNGSSKWLTSVNGTGKWEEYIHLLKCGDTGSFSSTSFFALDGGGTPTSSNPIIWHIAYATVFDITENDESVNVLKTEMSTAKNKVAIIETNLDSITQRISSTESKTHSIETTLGGKASKQEVAEVNNRIATIKANLDSITQRVSNTESKTNSLETNINGKASKQELTVVNNKVTEVTASLNGITQRVGNTESRINALDGKVAGAVTLQQFTEFKQSNDKFKFTVEQRSSVSNILPNSSFHGGDRGWLHGGNEFWSGPYSGYGFKGRITGAIKNRAAYNNPERYLQTHKAYKVKKNTTYTINFHYICEKNVQSMDAFVVLSDTEHGDYAQPICVLTAQGGSQSNATEEKPFTYKFNTGNHEWVWIRFDHNGMKSGVNWDEFCWVYVSEIGIYEGDVGAVKWTPKGGEVYSANYQMDGLGFKGTFEDGTYASLGKDGLEWFNAGTGHAYHALTYVTSFDIPIGNPGKAYIKLPAEFTKRRNSLKWTVALRGYYYSTSGDFFPFHIHCTGGRDYIENGLVVCEVQGYCKIQNAQNAGDVQFRPLTAMLIAIA